MASPIIRYINFCIICLASLILFSTTAFCGSSGKETAKETWAGEITGMFQGDLILDSFQEETTQADGLMTGKIKAKGVTVTGGYGGGVLQGTFKGQIKAGTLKGMFYGSISVAEGDSQVIGPLTGTLSDADGSGTYDFNTKAGRYKGKWTLKKTTGSD